MATFSNCLFVAVGGAIGSVFRYLLGLIPVPSQSFPIITLGINILGAFLIGVITAAAAKNAAFDPRFVLLLKVGLCGGFTTFSTFSNETVALLQNGKLLPALCYILLSVGLCLLAVVLGQNTVK